MNLLQLKHFYIIDSEEAVTYHRATQEMHLDLCWQRTGKISLVPEPSRNSYPVTRVCNQLQSQSLYYMNDMLPSNQNYFMSSKWTIFVWHKPWYDFQQPAFRQQMVLMAQLSQTKELTMASHSTSLQVESCIQFMFTNGTSLKSHESN